MKIVVTAECIWNGKVGNACECPIALALKALGHNDASVESDRLYLDDWYGGSAGYVWLPEKAKKFVDDFDHGRPVEPFEFELPADGQP